MSPPPRVWVWGQNLMLRTHVAIPTVKTPRLLRNYEGAHLKELNRKIPILGLENRCPSFYWWFGIPFSILCTTFSDTQFLHIKLVIDPSWNANLPSSSQYLWSAYVWPSPSLSGFHTPVLGISRSRCWDALKSNLQPQAFQEKNHGPHS